MKLLATADVGVYEIVDRGGRKTSFAYKLEIPQEPGEVQNELQIKKEASYTLSMKVLPMHALFFSRMQKEKPKKKRVIDCVRQFRTLQLFFACMHLFQFYV